MTIESSLIPPKSDKHKLQLTLIFMLVAHIVWAQTSSISGRIVNEYSPLTNVTVAIPTLKKVAVTDENGYYSITGLMPGNYPLRISYVGYRTIETEFDINVEEDLKRSYVIKLDVLNLGEIVVTGTRSQVERYNSPVIISSLHSELFEVTQSLSVADGLNFSPGLRVENNCQNCGFTQLRMNGLEGAYSQILINSRPVFSALAGVYGLEMLPANMVDRVEVIRGGGSVMYGGNAIAGTLNIITKEPVENAFDVAINQSYIKGGVPERTVNLTGSIVSDNLKNGITFFGFNKKRDQWDANDDGFSEIVKLQNNTFGFDVFHNFREQDQLKWGAYYISEFRRGGNKFDLFPHQTDITEQLKHNIISANISLEHLSKNNKHKVTLYGSLQHIDRDSYYGGGGRIISVGDSLTLDDILAINAYGISEDITSVTGVQYNHSINSKLTLTAGSEYIYNSVTDEMPGYQRLIDQQVGTLGTFAELEIKPVEKVTLLIGGRYDQLNIMGRYELANESYFNDQNISEFVPRFSAMYSVIDNLKLRASYAQGYRGPQAFDEDLHIETVGGAARFIRLDSKLEVEKSNSLSLSLNYNRNSSKNQMNFVIEGFYTHLNNPFIFSDQEELPSGVAVVTKRNGDGAMVTGANFEANFAFGSKLILLSGATMQQALYDSVEELWAPEVPSDEIDPTTTKRLLRTPNTYGYFSLEYNPFEALTMSYSGVITGSMDVPHVVDIDTERTIIKSTPAFFENNFKISYEVYSEKREKLEIFGGVQNMFNSYQNDFDIGATRDAGYIYGPIRPRTLFLGAKIGLK